MITFGKELVQDEARALDALASALLARETLDEQEILQVTELSAAPPLEMTKVV